MFDCNLCSRIAIVHWYTRRRRRNIQTTGTGTGNTRAKLKIEKCITNNSSSHSRPPSVYGMRACVIPYCATALDGTRLVPFENFRIDAIISPTTGSSHKLCHARLCRAQKRISFERGLFCRVPPTRPRCSTISIVRGSRYYYRVWPGITYLNWIRREQYNSVDQQLRQRRRRRRRRTIEFFSRKILLQFSLLLLLFGRSMYFAGAKKASAEWKMPGTC